MSLSKRISINVLALIGIGIAPWYVVVIYAIYCFWKFEILDVLVWMFILDILYGSVELHPHAMIPILLCTYIGALTVLVLGMIKKRIRYYS